VDERPLKLRLLRSAAAINHKGGSYGAGAL